MKDNQIALEDFFSSYVPPAHKAQFITTVRHDYGGKMCDKYDKGTLLDILSDVQLNNRHAMGF